MEHVQVRAIGRAIQPGNVPKTIKKGEHKLPLSCSRACADFVFTDD